MTRDDLAALIAALNRLDRKLADLDSIATMRMRMEVGNIAPTDQRRIEYLARLGASSAEIVRWTGLKLTNVAPVVSRWKARQRKPVKRARRALDAGGES